MNCVLIFLTFQGFEHANHILNELHIANNVKIFIFTQKCTV